MWQISNGVCPFLLRFCYAYYDILTIRKVGGESADRNPELKNNLL